MSENILRDDVGESPLQKRRRLDAEGEVEQSFGESSGGGESETSSSSAQSMSAANAFSIVPAGSSSVSQVIHPILSPITASASEPAPPVVTTDVAVARSPSQTAEAAVPSFIRGTLQDPEVRSIIDNLEQLQRQMRVLVDADSSTVLVSDMARRMLMTIYDMEAAIHRQHIERLRRERPTGATAAGPPFSDLDYLWNTILQRSEHIADLPPVLPNLDLDAERRRLNESLRDINSLTARLYPSVRPLSTRPLRRETTPSAPSPTTRPTWYRIEPSEDRWTRERRRRQELEHALDESLSVLPSLRHDSRANNPGFTPWGQSLRDTTMIPRQEPRSPVPDVSAPPTESHIESHLRALHAIHREPEDDPPIPESFVSWHGSRPNASASNSGEADDWTRVDWPMEVDEDPSWSSNPRLRNDPPADSATFRDPWIRAIERRERSTTPAALSRSATLPSSSSAAHPRDARFSPVVSERNDIVVAHRGVTSPVNPPLPTSRSSSTRPIVEEETSPISTRSDDLARRREALARRRAWHLRQVERATSQSSNGSRSGIDPSRRSIFGDTPTNLPGIQELFGASSPSSAGPSPGVVSPWERSGFYSPPIISPRISSTRPDPSSAAEEEMQDIAETIRLLEDDRPASQAARPAQAAHTPSWQPSDFLRQRQAFIREQSRNFGRSGSQRRDRANDGYGTIAENIRSTRTTDDREATRSFAAMRERFAREQERRRASGRTPLPTQTIARLEEQFAHVRHADFEQEALRTIFGALGHGQAHVPRGTPQNIIDGLPSGTYGDWARPGESEEHCPICFDDWTQDDSCLRMPNCTHWFHKPCLVQWLKTARTCPTCRAPVEAGRERERNIFGRPRLRISPGGTAPLAVRVRNDSAATNTSQRREGPSRPLPPFRTVDISDGEEDTVLVERRRRSPWRPTFGAPAQPTPWSNPGAAASRGASESWHDSGNTAGRSAPAPNNNTSGTAWSTSAAEPGWHVHDAWGATADVRDNGAAGPGGGASGGRSGGTGGVARNEGEGDGNAQTSRARSPWYTQNHWGSLDGSWPRGPW